MYGVIRGLKITVGRCLFFLPTNVTMTWGAKGRDRELARSSPDESDTWIFDPQKLSDQTFEPKDRWVLG